MKVLFRLAALVWATVVFTTSSAHAHPTPSSVAYVDFTVNGARLEQDVPIEELERALHQRLIEPGEAAASVARRHDERLRAYAAQHLRVVSSRTDAEWSGRVVAIEGHEASDGPRLRFHFELEAPRGEAADSLQIHDDIVAHEVVSHYTMIYVRSDWSLGAAPSVPRLVGTVHAGHDDVLVSRGGSFWRGLRSVVALGVQHIASGTDHLLFLFALLLVAPLSAVGQRWAARRSRREALLGLGKVVSAFTIGHSLTLALGAFGLVTMPAALVEACIALSILITALHALRPLFPRREALLAAGFGLIHGLGFATTLSGRNLGRAQTVWTLLGFNIGIELAQLGLLCLVVPWLLLLGRTRFYGAFRLLGSTLAGALSVGWLVERTTSRANPTGLLVGWLERHPLELLLALAAAAVLAQLLQARSSQVELEVSKSQALDLEALGPR